MILLYQDRRARLGQAPDEDIGRLFRLNRALSEALHQASDTVTAAQWNNRISGVFWLIRPDERAL